MEGYTYLGIIVLSALILASLQMPLGILLLLYHASLGKHIRKVTRRVVSSYLSGVALMYFLFMSGATLFIYVLSPSGVLPRTVLSITLGVLLALALISWFFYYKTHSTTELWLPHRLTKYLSVRAKATSDESEAYALGLLAPLVEIVFSAPLFLLTGDAVLHLSYGVAALGLALFVVISVLPLMILRIALRSGRSVVEAQRWRLRNKTFQRVFTGFGYLVLAGFLLVFVILSGGAR